MINKRDRFFKNVAFICGGTGITPAYQVMSAVSKDKSDRTSLSLLYGCRNESEIMLRS